MANTRRFNSVTIVSGSRFAPGSGYYVTAYEVGAQVVSVSGDVITVKAGHGFAANDKFIAGTSAATFSGIYSVTSTTSTTITMTPAGGDWTGLIAGDYLINLGADTGTSSPNYDGSPHTTYADHGEGTANTNAQVTTNTEGEYVYWFNNIQQIWELIRNASGTPVELLLDVIQGNILGPTSSTDNAIMRFDGTTGNRAQDYTSGAPTISDTGTVSVTALNINSTDVYTQIVTHDGAVVEEDGDVVLYT